MFDISPSLQLLRKYLPAGANMPQVMEGMAGGMGNVTGSPVAEAPQMLGGMEFMPQMNNQLMKPPMSMGQPGMEGMGRIQPVGRGITGSMPPPAPMVPSSSMSGGMSGMKPPKQGGMMNRFAGKGPQKSKNRY